MGFFDLFQQPKTPMITSILSDIAKERDNRGRLPILTTNKIFLKTENSATILTRLYMKKRQSKKICAKKYWIQYAGFVQRNESSHWWR